MKSLEIGSKTRGLIMKNIILSDPPTLSDRDHKQSNPRQLNPPNNLTTLPPLPPPRRLNDARVNGKNNTATEAVWSQPPETTVRRKKHKCARCLTQLGRFFNTGSPCPSCGQRICSSCRIRVHMMKKTWLCTLCVQERQIHMTSADWTMARTEVLMRAPASIRTEAQSRTLPRKEKKLAVLPHLSSASFNMGYQRRFSEVDEPTVGRFFTATHGRPVVTSGTPGPKKKQLKKSPPERVEKVVQVVTVPASELKNYVPNGTLPHSTTGSPQLKEGTLKRIIHTDNTSTTSLMKSPMIKQKFEHVSVVSASPAVSLSRITQSPKLVRKDGIEIHPRLLNGVSTVNHMSEYKSATLDRFYLRRRVSFSEDSTSSTSSSPLVNGATLPPHCPSPHHDYTSATLPRANRKVKRDESLLSAYTHMRASGDHSLSLLNVAHKSGLPLTEPQSTLKKLATNRNGIRHPSYNIDRTIFNRIDNRRRSFITRSTRFSSRSDDLLEKFIVSAITLDYDRFLTVVKGNLQETAGWYLSSGVDPWKQLHVSVIEIKPPQRIPSVDSIHVFHVTDTLSPMEVEVVLLEPPMEDTPPPTRLSRNNSMRRSSGKRVMNFVGKVPEKQLLPADPIPLVVHTSSSEESRNYDGGFIRGDEGFDGFYHSDNLKVPDEVVVNNEIIKSITGVTDDETDEFDLAELVSVHATEETDGYSPPIPESPLPDETETETYVRDVEELPERDQSMNGHEKLENMPAEPDDRSPVINGFIRGFPKLKEVAKGVHVSKRAEEVIPEFQRVRERLREAKKIAEPVQEKTAELEDFDEVWRVSSAIEHFRRVNQEVQDLKLFLKASHPQQNLEESVSKKLPERNPLEDANGSGSGNSDPPVINGHSKEVSRQNGFSTDANVTEPEETRETQTFVRDTEAIDGATAAAAVDDFDTVLELESDRSVSADSTVFDSHDDFDEFETGPCDTVESLPPNISERVNGDLTEGEPSVKKCVPAVRPVYLSQVSSDHEDHDRESNSSVYSDDGEAAAKACRKVDLSESDDEMDAESEAEMPEMWDAEALQQQQTIDYFGRLQVPLYTIEEESEDDEDRETLFTRTTNRRIMRSVVSLDMSPDEDGEEDLHSWQDDEEGSNLEQYFITGILQPTAKKPYYRSDMDFDALEEDELPVISREEPSIFKSARLQFASSDNYRMSSDNDMDDLSVSSPSDDESLYY